MIYQNIVPTHAPHWMEVLLPDGDIPVNLMNHSLLLTVWNSTYWSNSQFLLSWEFGWILWPMSWLVVKRSDISKYISLVTPWHSRWLHFLSPDPVILWNDQELHRTSTSSGLWWHKKEPFIAWKTFGHKVLPQIPSTHRVFNFPCQRISGRHHVRIDPVELQHFLLILRHYNALGIEMSHFQTMPMHLCYLGIEKNLISKTELIVKWNNKQQMNSGTVWCNQ